MSWLCETCRCWVADRLTTCPRCSYQSAKSHSAAKRVEGERGRELDRQEAAERFPIPEARAFRRKPVVVEAMLLVNSNIPEIITTFGEAVAWDMVELTVFTREGAVTAKPYEHYIVRGVEGEVYPIRRSIFEKTYEPIEKRGEAAATDQGRLATKEDAPAEVVFTAETHPELYALATEALAEIRAATPSTQETVLVERLKELMDELDKESQDMDISSGRAGGLDYAATRISRLLQAHSATTHPEKTKDEI